VFLSIPEKKSCHAFFFLTSENSHLTIACYQFGNKTTKIYYYNYYDSDMTANNYEVVEAGETIKFRGIVQRSVSQAFFLVFCTALAFLSLGLVLQIQFQDLGK